VTTSPQPDDDDDTADPGWRRRLLGGDPATVVGLLPPHVNVMVAVTRDISLVMYREAEILGTTREGVLRLALREYLVRHGLATVEEAEAGVVTRTNYVHRQERRARRSR
jgi:hypothetical protein